MNHQPSQHQTGAPAPLDRGRDLEGQDQLRDREPDQRDGYAPAVQHSPAGSIPIHQPVASRAGAIHSPESLLANHRVVAGPPTRPNSIDGPAIPSAAYGGAPHPQQPPPPPPPQSSALPVNDPNRPMPRHGPGQGQHNGSNGLGSGPGPAMGAQPPQAVFALGLQAIPGPGGGPPGLPQIAGPAQTHFAATAQHEPQPSPQNHPFFGGSPQSQALNHHQQQQQQQPILNDALEYLDQVKLQFSEHPQVYNHFLDIMKDFKSQAIDTPGVITRVSELFVGHPILIQGFNTFLPPGYKIECGPGNDPNTIRVTTPMGTLVQAIPGGGFQPELREQSATLAQPQPPQQPQQPQQQRFRDHTPVRGHPANDAPTGPPLLGDVSGPPPPGALPAPRNVKTPIPSHHHMDPSGIAGAEVVANAAAAYHGPSERKGPVEFNHAISYVNKIKTRFHDNPETYKQFLEILQTYQREQKPIQDVYDQVTTLFHGAPDLLEDFKQFLPEHAAAPPKTMLTDEPMTVPAPSCTPQPALRPDASRMPPIGSFAPPPSASRETKKRRAEKQIQPIPLPADAPLGPGRTAAPFAAGTKKAKLHHRAAAVTAANNISLEDAAAAAMEPTLTPVLLEPLPSVLPIANSRRELQFFEKVKKTLGRQRVNDFLKLCNLFNQTIVDRDTLYERGADFLTGSPDLLLAWKNLLGSDSQVSQVDSKPKPPSDKVSLSQCRGYGPSYRLLPQRERLRPCSGRDELCNFVLNDEWASHPTWASEDSGFVAHRKNLFEEGLHRVEEERHDYDFNIEANVKCIQLLEPIAQQMLIMTPAERETFSMTEALAGQTVSIFKRVAKKLYGEKGGAVINDLWSQPFEVVPVLLSRMKQKDEDWRFSQREWNKVWHQQSENMHLRSLDHMGIHVRINDKRNLSAKHLVDVIKSKAEDQRRERYRRMLTANGRDTPRAKEKELEEHQWMWNFDDKDLVADLMRLVLLFNNCNGQHSSGEKARVHAFFLDFVAPYFDLPEELLSQRIPDYSDEYSDEEGEELAPLVINARSRRTGASRRGGGGSGAGDLRRGVLDRLGAGTGAGTGTGVGSGSGSRAARDSSKESTPDGVSVLDDEDMTDVADDMAAPSATTATVAAAAAPGAVAPADLAATSAAVPGSPSGKRWLGMAPEAFVLDPDDVGGETAAAAVSAVLTRPQADGAFPRTWYNMFCNQTVFVFFSVLHVLYQRMREVKESTDSVLQALERQGYDKPARHIGLAENSMDFFKPGDDPATFWPRTMELLEEFIEGDREETSLHEVLRFYYMQSGWKLYTVQDLIKTLCRLSLVCTSPDPKEKTSSLINMYMSSRHVDQTSFQVEILNRKNAEKCIKEGELFVISWNPILSEARVRWLQKDKATFSGAGMDVMKRWQYYITSYIRLEPTEGVPRSRMHKSVLARNLPGPESELDLAKTPKQLAARQELASSICVLSYKPTWKPGTSESFAYDHKAKTDEDKEAHTRLHELGTRLRSHQFKQKFVTDCTWMGHFKPRKLKLALDAYNALVESGITPPPPPAEESDVKVVT